LSARCPVINQPDDLQKTLRREPRPAHVGLLRNNRVPWANRPEDKADDGVWAVT
jgi:hypothetical protein